MITMMMMMIIIIIGISCSNVHYCYVFLCLMVIRHYWSCIKSQMSSQGMYLLVFFHYDVLGVPFRRLGQVR